jgi:hypothetical protein
MPTEPEATVDAERAGLIQLIEDFLKPILLEVSAAGPAISSTQSPASSVTT